MSLLNSPHLHFNKALLLVTLPLTDLTEELNKLEGIICLAEKSQHFKDINALKKESINSQGIFFKLDMLTQNNIWRNKCVRRGREILKKRMNEGILVFPDTTTYYIVMVIIEWDTHKSRDRLMKQNREARNRSKYIWTFSTQ